LVRPGELILMQALVVYESMYGNTRAVATDVAPGWAARTR